MKLQICLLIAAASEALAFSTSSFGVQKQAQISTKLDAKKNGKRNIS